MHKNQTRILSHAIYKSNLSSVQSLMRQSIPRQIDKKSGAPRGKGSGILKEEERTNFFSPLHSLGLYNNVSCLRTVSVKNLLANSVILKCKL